MKLKGEIFDYDTKKGIVNASVYVSDKSGKPIKPVIGTYTDSNGNYSLEVPSNSYVTVSRVGYDRQTFSGRANNSNQLCSNDKCEWSLALYPKDKVIDSGGAITTSKDKVERKKWLTYLAWGIGGLSLIFLFWAIYKGTKK